MGDGRRWSNYVFAGLFAVAIILFSRIILPFLMPVLLGAFLVVLFEPARARLARLFPRHPSWTAGLSTAIVAALILVPLAAVAFVLSRELIELGSYARQLLQRVDLRHELLAQLPPELARLFDDAAGARVEKALLSALEGGASFLVPLLSAGSELVADCVLMTIAMYYFFLDGKRLYREACRLVPIDRRYLASFSKEFRDVAYALFYGNAVTGALQGLTGWLGFWLVGMPRPHIWALAMLAVSFLPVGGTAIVWLPVSIYLLLWRNAAAGLFLFGWGAFMVGVVDNLARPRICSARMTLHPLLVFLSMFGGFTVFGVMGLLVGPLIASLFMAMVRIYRRDFLPRAVAANEPEPDPEPDPDPDPLRPSPVVATRAIPPLGRIEQPAKV